jgi:hypothetical protein
MSVPLAKRLKELEKENERLRKARFTFVQCSPVRVRLASFSQSEDGSVRAILYPLS